jgi:hypothetical protein
MEQKTLEQALVHIIEKAVHGIDTATAFIQAELPDVVQQLLVWHAVDSFIWFALGVSLPALFWITYLVKGGRGNVKETDKYGTTYYEETLTHGRSGEVSEFGVFFCALGGGCSHVIGTLLALDNLTWLKILLAPKLYLLEYAARLIK